MPAGSLTEATPIDWLQLRDKTILVVGAGAFGSAIIREFVALGANVLAADAMESALASLQNPDQGRQVTTIRCDVAEQHACESLIETAVDRFGRLDAVVHSVGINPRVPIDELDVSDWDRTLRINTSSSLWLGRAASRSMRKTTSRGRMVFISSVSSLLAHPHHGAYAASKAALNQLVKVMAIEWASSGIGVNAIAPGYALTPLTAPYCADPDVLEQLRSKIPMERLALPIDVAAATVFLCSPRSEYITGHILVVDGGRTLD